MSMKEMALGLVYLENPDIIIMDRLAASISLVD